MAPAGSLATYPPEPGPQGESPMDTRKTSAPSTRVQRGIALHRERGHEIEHVGIGTYRVPSCTGRGSYVVYVSEG